MTNTKNATRTKAAPATVETAMCDTVQHHTTPAGGLRSMTIAITGEQADALAFLSEQTGIGTQTLITEYLISDTLEEIRDPVNSQAFGIAESTIYDTEAEASAVAGKLNKLRAGASKVFRRRLFYAVAVADGWGVKERE